MSGQSWINQDLLEGGVLHLTLQAPPVNALTAANLMALAALMDEIAADDSVRAVLITSAYKVFSAGLDLKQAQHFDLSQQNDIVEGLNVGFGKLFALPKPVVVAVNGAAIAGGLFFVLGADHRVGVARAQLGLAEVRVGVGFPVGPLEIARAMLDTNTLRRLMQSGKPIGAEAALSAGVLDELAEPDALFDTALAAARDLASIPPLAYGEVKHQLRGEVCKRIDAAIAAGGNAPEGGWFTEETSAAMKRMIG